MTDNKDFPALGSLPVKKPQKPAGGKKNKKKDNKETVQKINEDAKKPDDQQNPEDKATPKLKLGTRTFEKKAVVREPVRYAYYIPHEEPTMADENYFPTLGENAPVQPVLSEAKQKHQEFLERHELFKPYISLIPKEMWYVPDACIDALGYPIMMMLPDLYSYLWVYYNMFFNPDGSWATNNHTVMFTLGELWTHAEWRDRIIAKEQKELEEWERNYAEWLREQEEDELEDGISIDEADKFAKKGKGKKKKKTTKKKQPPPPPPKALNSYKRFEKKDDTVVAKPKTGFKEVSEITFEETVVEVDETRQPSSLVFIGHVDVGKSTICGNLMLMTGMVDERTMEKFKQEAREKNRDSWWLAYVMDINEDEKAKGKTVEVGRATLETTTKRYTIFDAPGHKNYVPDMIMGAAMADTAALVISARKGEYESGFERDGQTREHAQLARSLGVQKLIVVVNKMDEESVQWSEDRYNEIVSGVTPFLKEQCGYKSEDVVFVPISGLTGENINQKSKYCSWYTGPSLIEILDTVEVPKRDPEGPLRVPVLDKMKERGVIAFGKVESGTIKIGSRLAVMPNNLKCQVTGIYNCKQELVRYACPGENIQVKIRMIDDENLINKGDVLCPYDELAPICDVFEAELKILDLLPHRPIITPGYKSMMHLHTIGDEIVIQSLSGMYELDGTGKEYIKKNPKYCKSGSKVIVKISTRVPVCLEKYEFIEHMGRFTLRDEGRTIALGKVLRYKPIVPKKAEDKPVDDKDKLVERIKTADDDSTTTQQSFQEAKMKQEMDENEEEQITYGRPEAIENNE